MSNDTLVPPQEVLDSLAALEAIRKLDTCRRGASDLRGKFGACAAEDKPADAPKVKQGSRGFGFAGQSPS